MSDLKISELDTGTLLASGDETVVVRGGDNFRVPIIASGTFTPGVAFGGASVGVTYTSTEGTYTKIGNVCFFELTIIMSNKGSSTGNMTITGLPFTSTNASATHRSEFAIYGSNIPTITAGLIGIVFNNVAVISPFHMSSGGAAQLTNAECNNGTAFIIGGHYRTA
jgi:hypothetical protein